MLTHVSSVGVHALPVALQAYGALVIPEIFAQHGLLGFRECRVQALACQFNLMACGQMADPARFDREDNVAYKATPLCLGEVLVKFVLRP